MSDAAPSSIPEAAARSSTPPSAAADVFASQPASDIYFKASAASLALNIVVDPNSFAVSRSICRSFPVAPLIAETSDIALSKFFPTSIDCVTKSFMALTHIWIAFDARSARIPFMTVKPPLAFSADWPASSIASPRSSPASDDSFSASSRLSSSFVVLLMSASALFISIRICDIDFSFALCAALDFISSFSSSATTFSCCLYSSDVVPTVISSCFSFALSSLYVFTRLSCFFAFASYCVCIALYSAFNVDSLFFCSVSFLFNTSCFAVSAAVDVSFFPYSEVTTFISDDTSFRFCVICFNAALYSDSPVSLTAPPKPAI